MRKILLLILWRSLLTLGLAVLFWFLPSPRLRVGSTELNLPSIKSAIVVFFIVIVLGKTLYDTLFSRN